MYVWIILIPWVYICSLCLVVKIHELKLIPVFVQLVEQSLHDKMFLYFHWQPQGAYCYIRLSKF